MKIFSTPSINSSNIKSMSELLTIEANPLAVIRGLPTKMIPIDQIETRGDVVGDPIFLNRYVGYLKGRYAIYATRLSLSRIKPGFWLPSGATFKYVCDQVRDEDVAESARLIRLGNRPALHIYPSPNKSDAFDFVCPDDVVLYKAYESLGIRTPPVILLGKPESLDESSIAIRQFKCTYNPYTSHIDGIVGVTHELVPSILGVKKPDYSTSLSSLIDAVSVAKARVKEFHCGGMVTLHYHHTLYSVLLRAEETLKSIQLLFTNGLYLNAASLVRTLYELTLTFYVDWISPMQMYRYLQLASVMKESDWEKYCETTYVEQTKAGLSAHDARMLKDAKMFGFRLASTVSEKARLFPHGLERHKDVYAFLSQIVHHDFSMNARYTHTLDHGDETVFHEDAAATTIYCADIFTAAIVTRVLDDVGHPSIEHESKGSASN